MPPWACRDPPVSTATDTISHPAPRRRPRVGLSARLLGLTVLFVMMAEVLIYVPSVANFRQNWLATRLAGGATAALVLEAAPDGMVPHELALRLLDSIGARMVSIQRGGTRRVLAAQAMPLDADEEVDLRVLWPPTAIAQTFGALVSSPGRLIRIVGTPSPLTGDDTLEVVVEDTPLHAALLAFSRNILLLSLMISGITAGLVYLALSIVIVRPVRRLTRAIAAFRDNPEDGRAVLSPSDRTDELGAAERELAAMQRQLAGTLQQKNRLASLGLAVAKINHDLRNLLSSAHLLSDRLTASTDPMVQRFAPRLIDALDRAIGFTQTTLSYGGSAEPLPVRRRLPLRPLIEAVRELAGLDESGRIGWESAVEPDLEVDADPDQLSRILLNLVRNALQALQTGAAGAGREPDPARDRVSVTAWREGATVDIEVADTGPGVPERARQHLFEPFKGSARMGGTGLGLAIAAELATAHGGGVTLADGPGGARFRIAIPDRG